MSPLVLARRVLARHPVTRWVVVAVLASTAAVALAAQVRSVEATRRTWGDTVTVWVARSTIEPGTPLDAERVRADRYPVAMVPPDALTELGGTVRRLVGPGEILVDSDVGAADGPTALIPSGWAALAVPTGGLPVSAGDAVKIAAGGVLITGIVVDATDAAGAALVAVDEREVAAVAAAIVVGDAVLALSPSLPPP